MIIMSLHVPNKLHNMDKEKWILMKLDIAQRSHNLPIVVHIDLNTKKQNLPTLNKYLELKAWH